MLYFCVRLLLCVVALSAPAAVEAQTPPRNIEDPVAETERLQRECRDGRGPVETCLDYGNRLYRAGGVAADHATALRLYRAACERGNPGGCTNAGVILRLSDLVPRDLSAALSYSQRGCDGSDALGCLHVGYAYLDGAGTTVDLEVAQAKLNRACRLGEGVACAAEGRLYLDGSDAVAQNDRTALTAFRAGCALNDLESCGLEALMAYSARGMPGDAELAIRLYGRACRGQIAFACETLEIIRAEGPNDFAYAPLLAYEAQQRAFPPDLPAEQRYILAHAALAGGDAPLAVAGLEALSEEGLADANFSLGQIYYNGQGVQQDQTRGLRYIERAANVGHPYAQFMMANFNYYGVGVPRNEIWGIQMMRAAAEDGGMGEAAPIWREWQTRMDARYNARDAAMRQMAEENERSQAAADSANMARIWGLYSNSQNQQENGQVCGTIYRNNQAHHECMARETFDNYYNPNR